jgi:RND family efflux transporter MFP subunit
LALLGGILLAGCHPGKQTGPASVKGSPISVLVVTPGLETGSNEISVAGVVRGIHEADITARVGGEVQRVPVHLGQRVVRGQLLLTLSDQTFRARTVRAQASLSYARANFDRIEHLYRNGSASRSEWDRAKQTLDVATAEEQDASAQLSWTRVVAPFSGRVARKTVRKGDVVQTGAPLLSVIDATRLKVIAHVPDTWSAALHPGLSVHFSVKGADIPGTIRELSPQSDPVAHTVTVKVLLSRRSIPRSWSSPAKGPESTFVGMVGMYGKLLVPVMKEKELRIPVSAVIDHEGLKEVFVVVSDHAELRYIRTGRTEGASVEVLSGLRPGETVVASSPLPLADGMAVTPVARGMAK